MRYLIRWLFISGGAVTLARTMSGPLARSADARIIRGGFLLLLGSWLLTIADAFVPVMTLPPLGLLLFLFATAVSVASAIAAALLAGIVLLRRTGRIPVPAANERVLSIVAAVHN